MAGRFALFRHGRTASPTNAESGPDPWLWLTFLGKSRMYTIWPGAEGVSFDDYRGQPELLDLLRAFQWKALFVERRTEVVRAMRFFVFGHATYESLLNPFRGLTAKAILYGIDESWLRLAMDAQLAAVDTWLAADFGRGLFAHPRDFQPLPLLGIPGVTADNEAPSYYDDTWHFRPGRQRS